MNRCDELLQKSWEGEIVGRTFFAGLAEAMPDDAPMWGVLVALETATEALIRPVATAHGLSVDETAVVESAYALVEGTRTAPRDEVLASTRAVIPGYLEMYRELEALLPNRETWLGAELAEHEQALEAAIDGFLRGDTDWHARIAAYLGRHGVALEQPA